MKETGIVSDPALLAQYTAAPKAFPQPEMVLRCIPAQTIDSIRSALIELLQLWGDRMTSHINRTDSKRNELQQQLEDVNKQLDELEEKLDRSDGIRHGLTNAARGVGAGALGVAGAAMLSSVVAASSSESTPEIYDLLKQKQKDLSLQKIYAKDVIVMLSDIR